MKPTQILIVAVAGLLIGAGTGIGIKFYKERHANEDAAEQAALERLPAFAYPDLEGRTRRSDEWQGRVLVLNFWASWCPPCREETPLFVALQEEYAKQNVRFVGIAIDDAEPVRDFVDTYGVEYPILLGDMDAITLSRRLGNRFEGLPFTVVVAPDGRIVSRFQGGVSRQQLEPVLQRTIEQYRRSFESPERI